eukprot:1150929-Pelagomonas_calceolata.AAC.2
MHTLTRGRQTGPGVRSHWRVLTRCHAPLRWTDHDGGAYSGLAGPGAPLLQAHGQAGVQGLHVEGSQGVGRRVGLVGSGAPVGL